MNAKLKTVLALASCIAFLPTLAAARITERAEVLNGRVVLTQVGNLDLIVLVDNLPRGGDGVADQAFLYRSKTPLPVGLKDLSGHARVLVRPDALILVMAKGVAVSLNVRTDDNNAFDTGSVFKGANITRVDSGFQLSRLYGGEGVDLVDTAFDQLLPRSERKLSSSGQSSVVDNVLISMGCLSGGVGSTSCSLSGNVGPGGISCSVTCGSGYYACCGLDGCHCKAATSEL